MRPFIIAEAGINHNGNIVLAKRLIDAAINAGADAVKFQTFFDLGRLKEYELTKDEFDVLDEYCKCNGIEFMTTAHQISVLDYVNTLVYTHKIASPFLTNHMFLEKVKSFGKPIYLSTGSITNNDGMATDGEIGYALGILGDADITLLHCVSKYPCTEPHYYRIDQLRKMFSIPVGLSDHTKNIKIPRDIPVLEKHLKLRGVTSIDDPVSLDEVEFGKMVKYLES